MNHSPVFIVGTPRAGTTLTARILDRNSQIFIGGAIGFLHNTYARRREFGDPASDPDARKAIVDRLKKDLGGFRREREAHAEEIFRDGELARRLMAQRSYADIFSAFMEAQALQVGKAQWGNHAPSDLFEVPQIFSLYPEAKVILCVRNALDFLVSYRDSFKRSERRNRVKNAERLQKLYHPVITSLLWTASMRTGRRARERWGERVFVNRYEDLVANPEEQVRRLCAFIDVEFQQLMLGVEGNNSSEEVSQVGIFSTSVGRWRERLSKADAAICQMICRNEMRHFSYTSEPIRSGLGEVAWRVATTPVFAWRALSANRSRRALTLPYLAKRISALVRH